MSAKLEAIVDKLDARRVGADWRARCPAHDDSTPSLSISEGRDGRVLLKCHAGCTSDAVRVALGLEWSDLFDEPATDHPMRSVRTREYPAIADAIAAALRSLGPQWLHVHTYRYDGATGQLLFSVARFEGEKGAKSFRPLSHNGSGWALKDPPTPLPLYGLPHLANADLVFAVEGEGCAEVARELGFVATTSAHGARAASRSDWSPLAGKRVAILPDEDDAGRAYADSVTAILGSLQPPALVLRVQLPGLREGEDIADFVKTRRSSGRTNAEIRDEIMALVTSAHPDEAACPAPLPHAFRPFPVEVFPAPIREFIERRALADCVDRSFLALPILSFLAGSVGNAAEIELKAGWIEPSVIWTAVVGRSGSRKSVALKHAQAPLDRLQRKERKEWEARVRADADARDVQSTARNGVGPWRSTASGGTERLTKPAQRRRIVSDTTAEALASILSEQDQGVVLCRDELTGWIRSFDQYKSRGGSDEQFWLALYDARPEYIERKTGDERSLCIDRAAVSVAGGIQPGVLASVFTRSRQETGLVARILFAYPPDIAPTWNEEEPRLEAEQCYERILERLSRLPLERSPDGRIQPRRLKLDTAAREIFVSFYEEHARAATELDEASAAAYSKLLGSCGRLALVLEIARWASNTGTDAMPTGISRWAMEGAIQLARWFAREALRVQELLSRSPEDAQLYSLEQRIARRGGRVTVREWQRTRSKRTADDAKKELQALVDAQKGRWETVGNSTALVLTADPAVPRPAGTSGTVSVSVSETVSAEEHAADGRRLPQAQTTSDNSPNGAVSTPTSAPGQRSLAANAAGAHPQDALATDSHSTRDMLATERKRRENLRCRASH